jgi:hypothetical protein
VLALTGTFKEERMKLLVMFFMHLLFFSLCFNSYGNYIDNGDGTILDASNGLIWQKCNIGQYWSGIKCSGDPNQLIWKDASEYAENIQLAGYNDWRLPTLEELTTLLDVSQTEPPYINSIFSQYSDTFGTWTSDKHEYLEDTIYIVHFGAGGQGTADIYNSFIDSRAVRGTYVPPIPEQKWETEICIVNHGGDQFSGNLKAFSDSGIKVWEYEVSLPAYGRIEFDVGTSIEIDSTNIKSMRLDINSGQAVGYQKFYQSGKYRVGLEASPQANQESLFVPHIASDNQWWTGIGWTNTTNAAKSLQFAFDTGQQAQKQLGPGGHEAFSIASMFNNAEQPDIGSGQVSNGAGMAGLVLFGGDNVLSGVSLSDATTSTLFFPHVAHNSEWWTGLVIYNPGTQSADLTLTYFDAQGGQLGSNNSEVGPGRKIVGSPDNLNFPDGTEWFMVQASQPVTGFELFGTTDNNQLGGYSVVNLAAAKGVFPKLERDGWTGIAFVNPGEEMVQVQVKACSNIGNTVASNTVNLDSGHKWVAQPSELFPGQDISSATYVSFTATGDVVGFQLNGSTDGTMLDAIPALGGTHTGTQQLYFPHIAAD